MLCIAFAIRLQYICNAIVIRLHCIRIKQLNQSHSQTNKYALRIKVICIAIKLNKIKLNKIKDIKILTYFYIKKRKKNIFSFSFFYAVEIKLFKLNCQAKDNKCNKM